MNNPVILSKSRDRINRMYKMSFHLRRVSKFEVIR